MRILLTGATGYIAQRLLPARVTYISDKSGKVIYIFDSQTETQRHADEALKICLLVKKTD